MTGVETEDDSEDQRRKGGAGVPASEPPPSSTVVPAEPDAAAATPPTQTEGGDLAPTEAVQLWSPVSAGGGAAQPETARSTGSEKNAAATAAKKKAGAKEGTAGVKKSGSSIAAGTSGGGVCPGGEGSNGNMSEAEGGAPPVFESVLIFGGIVETAVSGVSCCEGERTTYSSKVLQSKMPRRSSAAVPGASGQRYHMKKGKATNPSLVEMHRTHLSYTHLRCVCVSRVYSRSVSVEQLYNG